MAAGSQSTDSYGRCPARLDLLGHVQVLEALSSERAAAAPAGRAACRSRVVSATNCTAPARTDAGAAAARLMMLLQCLIMTGVCLLLSALCSDCSQSFDLATSIDAQPASHCQPVVSSFVVSMDVQPRSFCCDATRHYTY